MSSVSKVVAERSQRALMELVAQPGNDVCADCKSRAPRWASHNLVKSLTLDSWTKEQVEVMRNIGNVKANQQWNPDERKNPPPTNMDEGERDSELEKYIRAKYEYKKFVSRKAEVEALLGPSQSKASLSARSQTLPVPSPSPTIPGSSVPRSAVSRGNSPVPPSQASTSLTSSQRPASAAASTSAFTTSPNATLHPGLGVSANSVITPPTRSSSNPITLPGGNTASNNPYAIAAGYQQYGQQFQSPQVANSSFGSGAGGYAPNPFQQQHLQPQIQSVPPVPLSAPVWNDMASLQTQSSQPTGMPFTGGALNLSSSPGIGGFSGLGSAASGSGSSPGLRSGFVGNSGSSSAAPNPFAQQQPLMNSATLNPYSNTANLTAASGSVAPNPFSSYAQSVPPAQHLQTPQSQSLNPFGVFGANANAGNGSSGIGIGTIGTGTPGGVGTSNLQQSGPQFHPQHPQSAMGYGFGSQQQQQAPQASAFGHQTSSPWPASAPASSGGAFMFGGASYDTQAYAQAQQQQQQQAYGYAQQGGNPFRS